MAYHTFKLPDAYVHFRNEKERDEYLGYTPGKKKKSQGWFETLWRGRRKKGTDFFSDAAQIPALKHLGHTRVKQQFPSLQNGKLKTIEVDAGFIVAPQRFKNDTEWFNLPMKPRQAHLMYAGHGMMPIPYHDHAIPKPLQRDLRRLAQQVYVKGLYMDPEQVEADCQQAKEEQVQAHYKRVQKMKDSHKNIRHWITRQYSRYLGGRFDSKEIWLPRGELFCEENRIKDSEHLGKIIDEEINLGAGKTRAFTAQ